MRKASGCFSLKVTASLHTNATSFPTLRSSFPAERCELSRLRFDFPAAFYRSLELEKHCPIDDPGILESLLGIVATLIPSEVENLCVSMVARAKLGK